MTTFNNDDDTVVQFDKAMFEAADAEITFKRVYDASSYEADGFPFSAFLDMMEQVSGYKIPRLQ
jgi:hypothetical protein